MEAFGDPSKEDEILDNLHSLHRVAWGQLANQLVRSDRSTLQLKPWSTSKRLSLDMKFKGLAPCGANSIAMMESIVHGSNVLSTMPHEPSNGSFEQLESYYKSTQFRFGWFMGKETEGRELRVGALDDDEFPFLGKKE
ncbi:unnamed protein product [Clonostachys rosea]|uniref:Uncharacterized protein n=1 Tax=Bionectria ochroleuca TaxID=29856 RepID=A0ABY6ULV8_BIOOC|nr:unnamed protein product [Clonostachys rosea]